MVTMAEQFDIELRLIDLPSLRLADHKAAYEESELLSAKVLPWGL
jgi:hypothetical protein